MLHHKIAALATLFFQSCTARPALPHSVQNQNADVALNKTLINRDDNHELNPGERHMLDEQNRAYPGIFWDKAYPGGNAPLGSEEDGGCFVWQYNILVEATRNAVRLASFHGRDLFQEDTSFNKFFVRNSVAPTGGRWTSSKESQTAFAAIRHNMLLPSRFPLDGTGKRKRRDRITYQCKDTDRPSSSKGCAGGVPAYTSDTNWAPNGWTIVFCPRFFDDFKYLNRILERQNVPESGLGPIDLVSYEQVLLHEWLHNDVMGFSQHLTDVVDTVDDSGPRRKVYGMSEARDYAWKFMKGSQMNINRNVVANVENYVWYFVDKMYGERWGWTGSGDSYPSSIAKVDTAILPLQASVLGQYHEPEGTDASDLPTPTWPENCHGELAIDTDDTTDLNCLYVKPINEDVDPTPTSLVPIPDFTRPAIICDCSATGCTPESPSCCNTNGC